jgi:hypothetical protein
LRKEEAFLKRVSLRLPDELHVRLLEAAAWNDRSLHAEILRRLDSTPDAVLPRQEANRLPALSDSTQEFKPDFKR